MAITIQSAPVIWDFNSVASSATARLVVIIARVCPFNSGVKEDCLDQFLHRCGAYKYLGQDLILFRKDGAQVEQDSSFVDPCQHRRFSSAQTGGKLVGAKTIACDRNESCGQGRRGRRPASDQRL